MQPKEDFIVIRDEYNTLKFDSKQSLIAVNDAFNNIISTLFDSNNFNDINKMVELINKYLKDITIISGASSKDTYDYETGIKHTISEITDIAGRCFHNNDGTYSVVALGSFPCIGLDSKAIHYINHELWHLFSNIAPYLYYKNDDLVRDNGEIKEEVNDCGVNIIDKQSGKKIDVKDKLKSKGYRIDRYYEEYNETLKEILASIGLFRQNGKDVTSIFMEYPDKWIDSNSTYKKTMPLTQLAIAAFSNYGFENYINNSDCGIITSTITCNDGTTMKTNDFLYGMIFNPFYAEERYEEVMR